MAHKWNVCTPPRRSRCVIEERRVGVPLWHHVDSEGDGVLDCACGVKVPFFARTMTRAATCRRCRVALHEREGRRS
jgi:hypothetical protein